MLERSNERKGALSSRDFGVPTSVPPVMMDENQWLQDASNELGFVLIKQYEMNPMDDQSGSPRLSVKLDMATYRALK